MRASDLDRFASLEYDEDRFDCADLVALVQRELFGRDVHVPNGRPRGVKGQAALAELARPYAVPTDYPTDGDLVLMFDGPEKRPGHAGVYFFLGHEPQVFHINEKVTRPVCHPVRMLASYGLRIEGYYTWAI